jgi:hypothetical protein
METYYTFIKLMLLYMLATSGLAAQAADQEKPNIILIYADDIGYSTTAASEPEDRLI